MEWIVILASYAFGCFSTGYYIFRLSTGKDIRDLGSGAAGARNVGRALGAWGFATTFLVDLAKGALVVWAARYLGLRPWGVVAAMNAVVIGHIWPLQLGFRGGKGLATAFGAMLVFDYRLAIASMLLSGATVVLTRHFTLSGMTGVVLSPAAAFAMRRPLTSVLGTTLLVALILIAHRRNISDLVAEMLPERVKEKPTA